MNRGGKDGGGSVEVKEADGGMTRIESWRMDEWMMGGRTGERWREVGIGGVVKAEGCR